MMILQTVRIYRYDDMTECIKAQLNPLRESQGAARCNIFVFLLTEAYV